MTVVIAVVDGPDVSGAGVEIPTGVLNDDELVISGLLADEI